MGEMYEWTPPAEIQKLEMVSKHLPRNQEIELMDGRWSLPYEFICPHCSQHQYRIELEFKPSLNFSSYSRYDPCVKILSLERMTEFGSIGQFYKYIKCPCGAMYYLALVHYERQPGRDVFVLTNILKVKIA